jgi:hypothetical protein
MRKNEGEMGKRDREIEEDLETVSQGDRSTSIKLLE